MSHDEPKSIINVYIDKFQFAQAKKYLAVKGPITMNVVHDAMFPLLSFNTSLVIERPPEGFPRAKKLSCFWHQEIVHPCLITQVFEDGSFKVRFLNRNDPPRIFPSDSYLGEIVSPKVPLSWRLRFWRLCR